MTDTALNHEILAKIGAELRDARLARGMSLESASKTLKIRKVYLKAIEAGDSGLLKFDAYTIGYVKHYAEFLEIDPRSYLEMIKTGQITSLPPISSDNLITSKDFIPSKFTIVFCLVLLILIYIFVEFGL